MKEILREATKFYSDLYTSRDIPECSIEEYLGKTYMENILNETEQRLCEGMLTIEECTQAVNGMKKNKSPGSDGLPSDFYKMFWPEVKYLVVNALNEAFKRDKCQIHKKSYPYTSVQERGQRVA